MILNARNFDARWDDSKARKEQHWQDHMNRIYQETGELWETIFALRPRRLSSRRIVWLGFVQRLEHGLDRHWEYRRVPEIHRWRRLRKFLGLPPRPKYKEPDWGL